LKLSEEQKKRQTVNITRLFFDNLIIALPDARHFDGDPQPRWEIRLKIGDRHRMLNLFQHAVTIVIKNWRSSPHVESISTCGDNRLFFFFLQRSPRFKNNTILLVLLSIISSRYQ
jgi:hypothetical protein